MRSFILTLLAPLAFGLPSIYGYPNPMFPEPPPLTVVPVSAAQPLPPQPPEEDEEPVLLTNVPSAPPPPAAAKKPAEEVPPATVFHWVDEDGVDNWSDAVPPAFESKAQKIQLREESYVRWK